MNKWRPKRPLEFKILFSDPSAWSRSDLDRWIRWTMSQYNIPDPSGAVAQQWAATAAGEEMDGQRFLQLSEQDFRDRMPQVRERESNSRNQES